MGNYARKHDLLEWPNEERMLALNTDGFFEKVFSITDETILRKLQNNARSEHFRKCDVLQDAGEEVIRVSFLRNGITRGYLVYEDGREITDCFVFRFGDAIVGCNCLNSPSQISFEAVSDCDIIQVPSVLLAELIDEYPVMQRVYSEILFRSLNQQWQVKQILYQSAMQRYLWFLQEYPGLIDLVGHKHIASFLGITPVTLSRLRRQLRE